MPWHSDRVRRVSAGVEISTSGPDWAYAAAVTLPADVTTLNDPYLQVTLRVESGRMGVGRQSSPEQPVQDERFIDASEHPVRIVYELPLRAPDRMILRKTSPLPMRALVSEFVLCHRVPGGRQAAANWGAPPYLHSQAGGA